MLEREILINLTLEEGYNNYIDFIGSLKDIIEEKSRDRIIGFLRDHLNRDLLIDTFKYNFNTTLSSNKIIFDKYKKEIPQNLGMNIEDLIKIPSIEDIANYTIDNIENFLEEEKGEIDISLDLDSYNIDLLIFNIISYYYSDPYRKCIYKTIENIREIIIDYSNRVIESEEEIDRLYIDYKERDLGERKKYREDYYKELGKLNHRKKRFLDRIHKLEERLKELEYIE